MNDDNCMRGKGAKLLISTFLALNSSSEKKVLCICLNNQEAQILLLLISAKLIYQPDALSFETATILKDRRLKCKVLVSAHMQIEAASMK